MITGVNGDRFQNDFSAKMRWERSVFVLPVGIRLVRSDLDDL